MPAVIARPRTEVARKRRPHAKSRKGCGNCKLRRIKCDEAQPSCKKCKLYGVACDYADEASFLELDAQGSFQVHFEPSIMLKSSGPKDTIGIGCALGRESNISAWIPLHNIGIVPSLVAAINTSLSIDASEFNRADSSWHFTSNDLELLSRFRNRTSFTIGNPAMIRVCRDLVCEVALKHNFLMHMLLSVTLMHDAHLANPSAGATTTISSQKALEHWNTASKLFNHVLSQPIPPSYRDAIWATGLFLGAASFWSIGSTDPYKVWPLKPPEPDDLSWLRIGEGKKHLWRLAQPLRSDSIFKDIVKDKSCLSVPEWTTFGGASISGSRIATRVMEAFGITGTLDEPRNVYYHPVLVLSKFPKVKLTPENALKFLYVMAVITPEFLELLESKDPRAIFIMGWWYILLATGELWWMSRRACIEGQAIRIWLRRQRGGGELANLLEEIEKNAEKEEEKVTAWFFEA